MKRYPVALSFTEIDCLVARRCWNFMLKGKVGCYEYSISDSKSVGYDLLARHLEVYRESAAIVYFVRRESFERKYARLELDISVERKAKDCFAILMNEEAECLLAQNYPHLRSVLYSPGSEQALFARLMLFAKDSVINSVPEPPRDERTP